MSLNEAPEKKPEKKPEKSARWLRGLIAVLTFVVVGVGLKITHEARLILRQTMSSWTEDVSADCAVVLTGGPYRIREGVDLLSRHSVKKLIISGVNPQVELRDVFGPWPYYGDIHDEDIILERRSRTTYGNAQQTLPLVEALGCRDFVLVTSRSHMYRALQTFRAEFPARYSITPRAVPGVNDTSVWDEVLWEALKSVFYSLWAY
jgi:uncharacterized SAM-binding protein YcdF (DUF218 family)